MSNEIATKHLNGKIQAKNCSYIYNNVRYFGAEFTVSIPLKKV